jgi:hypothetical protein
MDLIDPDNSAKYMSIIDSIVNLTNGQPDKIDYNFFLLLKINPNSIKEIKEAIDMFTQLVNNSGSFV